MALIATTSKCSCNYPKASRAASPGAIFPPTFARRRRGPPTASPPPTGGPRQGHGRKESGGRPEKGRHSHDSIQVISRRGSQYRPFKSPATSAEKNSRKDTEKEEKRSLFEVCGHYMFQVCGHYLTRAKANS